MHFHIAAAGGGPFCAGRKRAGSEEEIWDLTLAEFTGGSTPKSVSLAYLRRSVGRGVCGFLRNVRTDVRRSLWSGKARCRTYVDSANR